MGASPAAPAAPAAVSAPASPMPAAPPLLEPALGLPPFAVPASSRLPAVPPLPAVSPGVVNWSELEPPHSTSSDNATTPTKEPAAKREEIKPRRLIIGAQARAFLGPSQLVSFVLCVLCVLCACCRYSLSFE